ncbi:hypothetical protein MTO96_029798 [Rhipicephalus appendiculatus]
MAQAAPELKYLAFSRTVLRSVTINAATDEETIKNILQATGDELDPESLEENLPLVEHVRQLRFTNCHALFYDAIIDIARCCYNLRELYCVNCLVEPAALFAVLSLTLRCVTKLEWSLYDERHYESRLGGHAVDEIAAVSESNRPNVEVMYVEMTVTYSTAFLLDSFLKRCPGLRHLQVHTIGLKGYCDGALVLEAIRETSPLMETFKYSCERRASTTVETRLDITRANIDWRSKSERSYNVLTLADVVDRKLDLRCVQQAILSLEANSRADSLLEEAASQPQFWKNITRLTFVLTAPKRAELPTSLIAPCVQGNTMGQFFKACFSQITELNLCSSHFATEFNCCVLVACTLPQLRSLALTPCGVNHAWSLELLALGCNLLEELVIRSNPFGDVIPSCEACQFPLRFTRSNFGILQRKTRLRRLSIDEQAKFLDLTFLMVCRVEQLRLGVDNVGDENLAQCQSQLGELLAANPRLTSLTLVASRTTLSDCVARTFTKIRSLRHLAVLTTTYATYTSVDDFLLTLEVSLPLLLSVHVHYDIGSSDLVQAHSWIRQWGPEYGGETPVGKRRTTKGVILCDGPCLGRLCCVETFIGLVRPRNHF